MTRRLLLLVALAVLLTGAPARAEVPPPAPGALLTDAHEQPVAPGLSYADFTTYDEAGGWARVHVLTADLRRAGLRTELLGGTVTGVQPVSAHAGAARAVAGVNGDFFNINETNAAIGPEIGGAALRKATAAPAPIAGVGEDGIARLAELALEGTVTVGGRARTLDALNSTLGAGQIGVFTPLWGPGRRVFAVPGAPVAELVVRSGRVTAVRQSISEDPVPDDGFVVAARGAAAAWLAQAQPGEEATLSYAPRSSAPSPFAMALGARYPLVRDGVVLPQTDASEKPRTAMGWRDGGRTLLLVAVESPRDPGVTWQEVADLMGRLRSEDAVMLDGGGSTTLAAREPGDAAVTVRNRPTDGTERPVPNAVGVLTAPGSGRLNGFDVRPGDARVFAGLTRDFTAPGYDETYAPVAAEARLRAEPASLGRFDGDTLRAGRSGAGDVVAWDRGVQGEGRLTVLDDLARLRFDTTQVSLEPGAQREVRLLGEDDEGFEAPVHVRDAVLDYDRTVLDIEPTAAGTLQIAGRVDADGRGTVLRARVGGIEAVVPVTVGLRNEPLSTFESAADWRFLSAKATGAISLVDASDRPGAVPGNQALALDYNFAACCTSAAYAVHQPAPITLPAGAQRLALWVKGDGRSHWLRAMIADAGGANVPFTFAATVDWTGWRRVEGALPAGAAAPLRLARVYLVETNRARNDAGRILIDNLDARVGQTLDVERKAPPEDPFVADHGGLEDWRKHFAVISDTHVTAAAGRDSFSGRQTIAAFRAIAAAKPDFVVIAGDGVDTNRPEDFRFYEDLIHDYLGGIPVHWVPGNHESGASATGTLATFRAETGRPTRETFDYAGIRFITLDSNLGSFRLSDFDQLVDLRAQLDDAARDPDIKGVIVVDHHPPEDVSGGGASLLSDGLEAALVRRWLADLRERAGKHTAWFSGHAHTAAVNRTEGLLEVNTPSVGKQPYGPADRGGFFGWMLVGADPTPSPLRPGRPDPDSLVWLRAEVRPVIDGIELDAPSELADDAAAPVAATGITSEYGLRFPLRQPASVRWSGSAGLAVVRGEREAEHAARLPSTIAVLDRETMRLQAVRSGEVELTVAAGTEQATATVRVGTQATRRERVVEGARARVVAVAEPVGGDALLCALDARS
jgi:predicted phosphodiesterase